MCFLFFDHIKGLKDFTVYSLYISFIGFVVLYVIKCFQEPDFCRSEKHIENVRKLELMEQKGDVALKIVYSRNVEVISNPEERQLTDTKEGTS